jgi:hypothetical protein
MSTHTTINPSAVQPSHVAGPLESKVDQLPGGLELRRWRQSCCCGFLPMWESTVGLALESNARHFNRASR